MNIENENFKFKEIDQNVVLKILQDTNTSKSAGIDKMSGIFIKDGAEVLAKPLTQLINLSISSLTFPDPCKVAKLKALINK